MLLDRLGPERLTETWDLEACEVVAGLYADLHVPALPQLRSLTSYVDRWTARLAALPRDAPLPRRLVEQAVSLGRDFVTDDASTGTLIHADLHYENVMAVGAAGWLAIDPKPVSGDPHYEPAPMLWNRTEELAGDVRAGLRRRFHTLVDTAGLDEDRARDWVVVRMLHNCLWAVEEDPGLEQELNRDLITACSRPPRPCRTETHVSSGFRRPRRPDTMPGVARSDTDRTRPRVDRRRGDRHRARQ